MSTDKREQQNNKNRLKNHLAAMQKNVKTGLYFLNSLTFPANPPVLPFSHEPFFKAVGVKSVWGVKR